MLQNQNPGRRWKQWLVLPALGGLFFVSSHTALAQPTLVPSQGAQPVLTDAAKKARSEELSRKLREALHQDSLRTAGRFEPGTKQQFNVANENKPGEMKVTVTRVKANQVDGKATAAHPPDVPLTYVEQPPHLPGDGGNLAIVQAIKDRVADAYGKIAASEPMPTGRVFVRFTVDVDGTVKDAEIVKGLLPAWDALVLAAVQKLPRFEPGRQHNGQPAAVTFTVPVQFQSKP